MLSRPRRAGPMANGSQTLNMLRGFIILLVFQGIGEAAAHYGKVPIPGPVIGMVLLFLALTFRGSEMPIWLGQTGYFMIRWLALMFVPACVGLFFLPTSHVGQWLAIIGVIVLATLLTLTATACVMKHLLQPETKHR